MNAIRAVCLSIVCGMMGSIAPSAGAHAPSDTITMELPAPELGVVRIHFGRPVGIRPQIAAPVSQRPVPENAASAVSRVAGSQAEGLLSGRMPYSWFESTAQGPALIFLSYQPGLPPDTLFLTEAMDRVPRAGLEAPPLTGIGVPERLGTATVALPELEAVERALLDEGYFHALSIQFEFDSANLLDISDPVLDAVADVMGRHPGLRLEISGHTDNVGADSYNVRLSKSRAEAVRDDLVRRGIDSSRLSAVGYGYHRPLLPNQNQTYRALNRRVEFRVIERDEEAQAAQVDDQVADDEMLETLQDALREALRKSLRSGDNR